MFDKVMHTNQVADTSNNKAKTAVCKKLGAKTIIEDHWDYALDCAENDIKVCLYTAPWNIKKKLHKNMSRVSSWTDVVSYFGN